jgi:polyphosphate kinase
MLLPGMEIVAAYPFRVTRDADPDLEEDEASDLLVAIQESIEMRHFGSAVRLEVNNNMPERIRRILLSNLVLTPEQLFAVDGPIGLADLMQLTRVDRPELKDPPFAPSAPPALASGANLFSVISRRNVLLYHPYDGFSPVVEFLSAAARDPDVLAIKQTLYRVGANSPIVHALMEARKNGKEVTVLLELKARFDEENNIVWARELERSGVHVVYGVVGLKTHAKMCLVARREGDGITRYVHLSTGNYNPVTARVYTDMGFFTSDPAIASDVSVLFNALTGYSNKDAYRKLLVAPRRMRQEILDRIERVTEGHRQRGDGHLVFKLNALTDTACIQALYRASQAGVPVDLQVRGICCLRPGLPGLSERITVTSLVGRFLEHSRIYYFRSGVEEEMLLGSADLMPRNLDGRVEILFPLENPRMRQIVRDSILFKHLKDTRHVRRMAADGLYHLVHPLPGEPELDSQAWMLEHRGVWNAEG